MLTEMADTQWNKSVIIITLNDQPHCIPPVRALKTMLVTEDINHMLKLEKQRGHQSQIHGIYGNVPHHNSSGDIDMHSYLKFPYSAAKPMMLRVCKVLM